MNNPSSLSSSDDSSALSPKPKIRAPAESIAVDELLQKPKLKAKPVVAQIQLEAVEEALYEVRKKVYPRAVSGIFARWRWIMVWVTQIIFYGLCWLQWNGRQAVLFHLTERKFYIGGAVFWPQDVVYLAVILIISALSLFLFTAVAGRLWCGFTCPQTVYTQIFLWIEAKVEGDRLKRMKLDTQPWGVHKILVKGSKYVLWLAVAIWTGISFVGYFTPIRELMRGLVHFQLSGWETFWVFFYGAFTYLLAGVMREQVCKYMCPYARFQGVMFDSDTLTITYDQERGDPRGSRRKGVIPASQGLGDCVDCGICVQVCPTGIDIRNGLQAECIGCAACIDACDQVMEKMDYPKGLIRYSTENAVKQHWGMREILAHVLRPRVLIYSSVLLAICITFAWSLATRSTIRLDVIRDRNTLSREVEGGQIENVYTLRLMNMAEVPRKLNVSVTGLEGIRLAEDLNIQLKAGEDLSVPVQVHVPLEVAKKGSHPIYFHIQAQEQGDVVHEKSSFLMP